MSRNTHLHRSCIILANGLFPTRPDIIEKLQSGVDIICCDGASNNLVKHGFEPTYIVGDLDSISEDVKKKYTDRLFHISDQGCNDLTKTIDFAVDRGYKQLTIFGATGLREDHTLGNLSLLVEHHQKADIELISDFGVFSVHSGNVDIKSRCGQQISIFAINSTIVSSQNLKYPLKELLLDRWWKGTLNESLADSFRLNIEDNKKVLVYRVFL